MSNTLGEQILKLIIDSIGKNPTSKAEAVALVAYVLERDVLPLVDQLKQWSVKELAEAEQVLAKRAMEGIKVVEKYIEDKVEEVAASSWCRPKPKQDSKKEKIDSTDQKQ